MTSDPMIFVWGGVYVAAVGTAALINGVELGCYSVNRVRLDVRAERDKPADIRARRLRRELSKPDVLLSTLLIAANVMGFVGAVALTEVFERSGMSKAGTAVLSAAVLGPCLFVFGDAVPKELFRVNAERLTYALSGPLTGLRLGLTYTGVLPVVRGLTRLAERALGLQGEGISDARQRIAQLLKEGAGAGVLSESQVSLMDRAMLLRGVKVRDEMVPWTSVRVIAADADRGRLLRVLGDVPHVRLPAVDRSGRVVGVLRQIDLHLRPEVAPAALLREPARLRETWGVREALVAVRASPARLGIVEDDAGKPVGVVTPKDLIEPLTGEIHGL